MYINGVDLKKHKRLIWNLLARHSDSQLETIVRHMAGKTTHNERKAILTEIERMSEQCTRRMDFAPYFADLCEEYHFDGIIHNIDPLSQERFNKAIKKTNGKFTIAIYEDTTKQAKSRYLDMIAEQAKISEIIPATSLSLLREYNLEKAKKDTLKSGIFSYDPSGLTDKGLKNQTNNIEIISLSEDEIMFLTSSQELLNCENPFLYLWDIERSYGIGDKVIIKCLHKEATIQPDDSVEIKITIDPSANNAQVRKLRTLIEFRDKPEVAKNVSMQSLYKSIEQRIHEHYFINKTDSIPMILSHYESVWRPNSAYITEDTNNFWHSFTTIKDDHLIERIINLESFQQAINQQPRSTLYYIASPILIDGNKEVICVEYSKLAEDPSACSLFKLYHKANRVKLIRFEIGATSVKETQFSPSILQNMIGGNLAMINAKPNNQVQDIVKNAQIFMTIHNDTEMFNALNLDQMIERSKMPLYYKDKLIRKHILPEVNKNKVLHVAYENLREIRAEDRFAHKMDVSIRIKESADEIDSNQSMKAHTINISSKGLCISVNNPELFERNKEVYLTFDHMNKNLKVKIIDQPYQIMNIIGKSVHLMATGSVKKNTARKTLTKLIYQNLDRLKATGIKDKVYGLSKAMRSIYTQNHLTIPFFISREKRQNFIETVLINKFSKLSNIKDEQELINFFSSPSFSAFTSQLFADITEDKTMVEGYIILLPKIKLKSGAEKSFWIKDLSEIFLSENGGELIKKIQSVDTPSILKVKLRTPGLNSDKFYADELTYLKRLTSGMSESLEAYSNDMLAVGELSEVTSLIMDKINADDIKLSSKIA